MFKQIQNLQNISDEFKLRTEKANLFDTHFSLQSPNKKAAHLMEKV
jgi:hypothetical protein